MSRKTAAAGARPARRTGMRGVLVVVAALVGTSGCSARDAYESTFNLGLPEPATEQADSIRELWLGAMAASTAVGLFVLGLILWACVAYRKRGDTLPRQVRYNLPIEVLYTILPMVIISVFFYYTVESQNFINKESENPDVTIAVVGFQWNWQFNHLDGDDDPDNNVVVTGEPLKPAPLVLPVGQTIRFEQTSNDVIHSFWIPAFLFKRDAIPGLENSFELTLKPETAGTTFIGRCAEFCGEKHDRMNFEVRAVTPAQYAEYLAEERAKIGNAGSPAPGAADQNTTVIRDSAEEQAAGAGKADESSSP